MGRFTSFPKDGYPHIVSYDQRSHVLIDLRCTGSMAALARYWRGRHEPDPKAVS